MTRSRRILITFVVVLSCLGCDQATKRIAQQRLVPSAPVTVVNNILHLEYTENSGAMMGVGSDLSPDARIWLFEIFAGGALMAILAFAVLGKGLDFTAILSLSLLLGGGLGNLVDRLFKGGIVVDFMILTLGPLRTAIFNFADVSILSGILLLLFSRIPPFLRSAKDPHEG
jgi:signal peptidase II